MHVDDQVVVVRGDFGDFARVNGTCHRHQNIEPIERLHRRGDGLSQGVSLADVDDQAEVLGAEFLRERLGVVRSVDHGHARALIGEQLCGDAANAAGAAGDDDGLAAKQRRRQRRQDGSDVTVMSAFSWREFQVHVFAQSDADRKEPGRRRTRRNGRIVLTGGVSSIRLVHAPPAFAPNIGGNEISPLFPASHLHSTGSTSGEHLRL